MTSSRDVHDMLGITADSNAQGRPLKKKGKQISKRPDGMAREVFSLLGERAPPIPIAEPAQYKAKRRVVPTENIRWKHAPFVVSTRSDGLLLRHWRKELEDAVSGLAPEDDTSAAETSAENGVSEEQSDLPPNVLASRDKTMARLEKNMKERAVQSEAPAVSSEYVFAKYDVEVDIPKYDDNLYNAHLQSSDWTREETDYLVKLYFEYHGKWPVIVDRWEYKPSNPEANSKSRTTEDMKARFYQVCAKVMAAHTPVSNMSATEFANHEKMMKFDPKHEAERKSHRERLLIRSKSERDEEKYLLVELERIFNRQDRFEAEVRDLRQRLDHSLTDDVPNAQLYQTSQEITGLFQKFLQRDKTSKQQRQKSIYDAGAASSPTTATNQNATAATPVNQGSATKKGSTAGQGHQSNRRALSSADEARFGVSTHERLTSGVTFKSDRIAKARQAKSQTKTEKIATILAELGVPDILHMPTNAVCSSVEKLVGKVNVIIDQRRVIEKEENELRIAKEHRAMREAQDAPAVPSSDPLTRQEQSSPTKGEGKDDDNEDTDVKKEVGTNDEGESQVDGDPEEVEPDEIEPEEDEPEEDEQEEVEQEEVEQEEVEQEEVEQEEAEPEEAELEEAELEEDAPEEAGPEEAEPQETGIEEAEAEEEEPEEATETKEATLTVPATRGSQMRSHKRSASVMSASSTGSGASRATSKRLKASRN